MKRTKKIRTFILTVCILVSILSAGFVVSARTTITFFSAILGDDSDIAIDGTNVQVFINNANVFNGTTFDGGGYAWNTNTIRQGSRITIAVTPPIEYRISRLRIRTNEETLLDLSNPISTTFNVVATDAEAMETLSVLIGLVPIVPETPIEVLLDGAAIEFDVPPQVTDGRTLVPLRAIFEALGAEVHWNPETQVVTGTKGNTTVVLPIGSTTPTVNGQTVTIDVPGTVVNGRTLVPLRFVAESFGVNVNWNAETRVITITS